MQKESVYKGRAKRSGTKKKTKSKTILRERERDQSMRLGDGIVKINDRGFYEVVIERG